MTADDFATAAFDESHRRLCLAGFATPSDMAQAQGFRDGASWAWDRLALIIAAEVRKARADALREYADALAAVPDYAPTEYDQGRVDQRHATIEELHVRADEHEKKG